MDDHLFEEVVGPLIEHAFRRAAARLPPFEAEAAVQAAAIAAWRAFPRLGPDDDAEAWFGRFLERELTDAPDRAQSVPEPPAGLTAEVLDIARSHSRPSALAVHGPLSAAMAAALVLVLGIAAFHVAGQLLPLPRLLAAQPGLSERDFGPVPGGGPLAWAIDDRHSNWLIAFDGSGHPVGTLKVRENISTVGGVPAFGAGSTVTANRDGSVLWLGDKFIDAGGVTVGSLGSVTGLFAWTDNPDEVCGITYPGPGTWVLWTYVFGERIRTFYRGTGPAPDLVGCSIWNDVALVADRSVAPGAGWITNLQEIRVSDGAAAGTTPVDEQDHVVSVVTTPDVRLVGENAEGFAEVASLSDGSVLLRLASTSLIAFSGDSGLLLTRTAHGPCAVLDLPRGDLRVAALPGIAAAGDALAWPLGDSGFMYWQPDAPGFVLTSPAGGHQAAYGRVTAIPSGVVVFIAPSPGGD